MLGDVDLPLVAVHVIAPQSSLPLVVHLCHWDQAHLVTLPQNLLVGEFGQVVGHQLGRCGLYHFVIFKCINREHLGVLLLKSHLPGHVSDQVIRYLQFLGDVLRGVHLPEDGQLNKAKDVCGALAR